MGKGKEEKFIPPDPITMMSPLGGVGSSSARGKVRVKESPPGEKRVQKEREGFFMIFLRIVRR